MSLPNNLKLHRVQLSDGQVEPQGPIHYFKDLFVSSFLESRGPDNGPFSFAKIVLTSSLAGQACALGV